MSASGQRKSSINDLVHILENPRSKTLPRRREVQLDREQIRREMKNKWRGSNVVMKTLDFARFSSQKSPALEPNCSSNGIWKGYLLRREVI